MLRLELFSPHYHKGYSEREFKKDMRKVLEMAGIQGTSTCLLIEDHHLIKSEFLEMLNSLISS